MGPESFGSGYTAYHSHLFNLINFMLFFWVQFCARNNNSIQLPPWALCCPHNFSLILIAWNKVRMFVCRHLKRKLILKLKIRLSYWIATWINSFHWISYLLSWWRGCGILHFHISMDAGSSSCSMAQARHFWFCSLLPRQAHRLQFCSLLPRRAHHSRHW